MACDVSPVAMFYSVQLVLIMFQYCSDFNLSFNSESLYKQLPVSLGPQMDLSAAFSIYLSSSPTHSNFRKKSLQIHPDAKCVDVSGIVRRVCSGLIGIPGVQPQEKTFH